MSMQAGGVLLERHRTGMGMLYKLEEDLTGQLAHHTWTFTT